MKRLMWLLRRRSALFALSTGVALIVASLALQALVVKPLEQHVEALQVERNGPRDAMLERLGDDLARQDSPQAQLSSFHGYFARDEGLTHRLARVHAIARSLGLEIKRAEYRLNSQPERKLDRYQMVVPIQGSYLMVRAFITAALAALPTLSLEQVQFQRQNVGDDAVDAQISFTFYLAK